MRIRQLLIAIVMLAAALLAPAAATHVHAQGPITPGTPTIGYTPTSTHNLAWDAAETASEAPEDAVVGYELVSFTEVNNGVVVKTWALGNVTTAQVLGKELGTARQFVTIRAISAAGLKSGWSNTLPFVPASAPGVPGNLRRIVVQ